MNFRGLCDGCPLQASCTTSATGRKVTLHEHDALMRQHRQRMTDPRLQETYRARRPMVERSLAWIVAGGNRKLRYRGVTKNNAWLHHRAAAINLKRLTALGLTSQNGTWATI